MRREAAPAVTMREETPTAAKWEGAGGGDERSGAYGGEEGTCGSGDGDVKGAPGEAATTVVKGAPAWTMLEELRVWGSHVGWVTDTYSIDIVWEKKGRQRNIFSLSTVSLHSEHRLINLDDKIKLFWHHL